MSNKYAEPLPHVDLFQRGYDSFGQSSLVFSGTQVNAKTGSYYEAGVPSTFIQDGDLINRLNIVDGYLQSDGFVSGSTGWRIDADGNVEFETGTFRGDIEGSTITGATIWAKNTSVGIDIKIGTDGIITFYNNGTKLGEISASSASSALGVYGKSKSFFSTTDAVLASKNTAVVIEENDLTIKAEDDLLFESKDLTVLKTTGTSGQVQLLAQESGGDVVLAAGGDVFVYEADDWKVAYNSDNDSSECRWVSNGNVRMRLSASGNATCDGSFTGGGADYAELFESTDGKKIPNGTTVVLERGKIRKANTGESPFGVISAVPNVLGNVGGEDSDTAWKGKYLKNKDGSYIMEKAEFWSNRKVKKKKIKGNFFSKIIKKIKPKRIEKDGVKNSGWSDETEPTLTKNAEKKIVERKEINPEWNKDEKYVSRCDREEWSAVALLGQILVKKGAPVAENWLFIKQENDEYDKYLIK